VDHATLKVVNTKVLQARTLDPQHELRGAVAGVEAELARLSNVSDLLASWARLRDVLKLEPAPELHACPSCGRLGMRAATRCGFCWTELDVLVTVTP